MGIRREEEMEMFDDEIEEIIEIKETEELGNDNFGLFYVMSIYL